MSPACSLTLNTAWDRPADVSGLVWPPGLEHDQHLEFIKNATVQVSLDTMWTRPSQPTFSQAGISSLLLYIFEDAL